MAPSGDEQVLVENGAQTELEFGSCSTCNKSCSTKCSHCKKAFYCSVDCQRTQRRSHKRDCFPAELIANGVSEPYWVATRDIKEGELIFGEYPVMRGPDDNLPKEYSARGLKHIAICVGCMKIMEPSNIWKCSECSWQVCNENCEKNPQHADAECKVFATKKFGPTGNMEEYNMVSVLRCLLLKSTNPVKWTQIMKLVPDKRRGTDKRTESERKMEQFEGQCQIEFFNDILGLKNLTASEISHVTKIWDTLKVQPLSSMNTHCESLLFFHLKFISHSCLPNTKSLDEGTQSKKLDTLATTRILKGSRITNSILYGNCMDGTKPRRKALKMANGFECKCERCSDPTECGTFMSAIKCPGEKGGGHSISEWDQNIGYLLPRNPLDENSIWQCNSNSCNLSFTDIQISKILEPVWAEISAFVRRADERKFEVLFREDVNHEDYSLICDMENYLEKMGKVLHSNHYFQFALIKKILIGMSSCISPVEINPQIVFRTHRLEISERMQQLAKHCVKLSKIILPGVSLFTGRMLYFLATSKWIWITENVSQGGSVDQTFNELQLAGELNNRVEVIFKGCAAESPEMILLEYLKTWESIANELFLANPAFASRLG